MNHFLFESKIGSNVVGWVRLFWRRVLRETRTNGRAYVISVAGVLVATLLRIGMDPVLGEHHPFTLYFASVAIAAWYGGFGPALLATMLSYFAADWFFITPRFEFNLPHENLDEFLALLAFVFSCFAIAITSAIMRRALTRAREKQKELESEIAEKHRAQEALQQAQAQLREYTGMLEQRVQERTAHLHETIRSLEGVCYHLAHDLRAPLRATEGFASILLKEYMDRLDPEGTSYLESISKASARMELLIQGLMEYGRMGHGAFRVRNSNVKRTLERVLEQLSGEISACGAGIELGNEWPEVMANDQLLEVVFWHLLQNSLKFVQPKVRPHIRIFAQINSNQGAEERLNNLAAKFVRFVVQDNGIGMPAEHISRAFWIFERLHPRENFPGTGIGLAIVSKAVERMDGRLGAESRVNEGTTVWFELPAAHFGRSAGVVAQTNRLEEEPDLISAQLQRK